MTKSLSLKQWWKEIVVYQIYPRSFCDSNGDGVGDLRGIISKLDYIQSLGITAIWLNPIYKSPNDDGGYDISDYYAIQPEFGTMEDFDELLRQLRRRKIKLIMDVVLNHSSDEHRWFLESRRSPDNPFREFYFWRKGKNGGPPNNWISFFGGSAWEYDNQTEEYYLHLFSKKQPDLNWETPELREEIYKVMEFWLKKGVDGLRLDVITAISKRTDFPDTDEADFNETIGKFYTNGPKLKEYIQEMKSKVWKNFDVMTVGEGPGINPENGMYYLDENHGLNMIFHFGHMFMDQGPGGRFDPKPWTMKEFKNIFTVWDQALEEKGWGSIFLGNHDFARSLSRWGNDHVYWEKSAKLLCTLLLSMRGTPFIYTGDEIGMTNIKLNSLEESQDIETINGHEQARKKGLSDEAFLKIANYCGRDNSRTPFQWDAGLYGGFSVSKPWMKVNENKSLINLQNQERDGDSIVNYYRKMIALRQANDVLVYGAYDEIPAGIDSLYAYSRTDEKAELLIMLNFSDREIKLEDRIKSTGKRLIGNYQDEREGILRPWEALVFKVL